MAVVKKKMFTVYVETIADSVVGVVQRLENIFVKVIGVNGQIHIHRHLIVDSVA
jgi:hypothetical protein